MDLPAWLDEVPWIMVVVSTVGIYVAVIAGTRLNGLRSFSTISAFDFAMTIAIGSLMATAILNPQPSLGTALVALALLFVLQALVAHGRRFSRAFSHWVDNEPILLMRHGEVLEKNLHRARISRDDLRAKLRGQGVLRYRDVDAVVLETTGTFSILTRQEGVEIDAALLQDVRK